MTQLTHSILFLACIMTALITTSCSSPQKEEGLVGYWKLQGDCKDYSGNENHGINHGVSLDSGSFDGKKSYIEIPSSASLKLGSGDFSISLWIQLPGPINDIVGDVVDFYDPTQRKGITLAVSSSAGGYQSQGTDRHLYFGIDNAQATEWQDCGRPSLTSNYVSNSLTVYKGKLYAAIAGAKDQKDWAHVFRYEGGQQWTDCGRVGNEKTEGVLPLIVHNGELYAATSSYDWTRVNQPGRYDPGRVYRYMGGTSWEEVSGPLGDNRTLTNMASYNGKLFAGGGPNTQAMFTQDTGKVWKLSSKFPTEGPRKCFPHSSRVYRDKLFVAFPSAYAFDGQQWMYAGVPSEPESTLQTHSLTVYQGDLIAGTWPLAKVSRYLGGERWKVFGRVGRDGTEVNALVVYNGKLYGGSIPRATVSRHESDSTWTVIKEFYSPEGWTPVPPIENGGNPTNEQVNAWTRVTSMTVYNGKLFAGIGSCTSSALDAPADIRGKVFAMEAGKNVSYHEDLGSGWKHITAIRAGGKLKLYVDGSLIQESDAFDPSLYDLSHDQPLRLGFGQNDYFTGKMKEVRTYNRALSEAEIKNLASDIASK